MLINEIISKIENGEIKRFHTSILRRIVYLDGKPTTVESTEPPVPLSESLSMLTHLYDRYRHSRPSMRTGRRNPLFRALPISKLSNEDMNFGESRHIAQAKLEATLILHLSNGSLRWDTSIMGDHWYYECGSKHFILRRKWIEPSLLPIAP